MNGRTAHAKNRTAAKAPAKKKNEQTKDRRIFFGKKEITPESFDFSASKDGTRTMRITVIDGKKEIVLNMDADAILSLFGGLMDTAPEIFGFKSERRETDIMYR